MFRTLLAFVPAWAWALLLALALACSAGAGWRQGAAHKQAQWDAADLKRERAEADQRREDARIARAAAAEYQAWRADQARRQADTARRLRDALQQPVSCPASGRLADVVVPAAVLDQLRSAGADRPASGPAAR